MTFVVYAFVALVAVPTFVLLTEVVAALLPGRDRVAAIDPGLRVAVLVPAHDEEGGIGATLASLRPQLRPGDRLVVVADNCSDATAARARALGVDVLERRDERRRGKSYAVHSGVVYLAADPPDIVIIVDADCALAPGSVDALRAAAVNRPAQAAYVMRAPDGAPASRLLAELMFLFRNVVRPRGLDRLGLPCLLTGSGMAFPWSSIRSAALDSGSVVEDVALAIELARDGTPPYFCERARVSSEFPSRDAAATAQQTRWLWGVLRTFGHVPELCAAAWKHRRPALLGLAAELAVPVTILFALWALVLALAFTIGLTNSNWGPLACASAGAAAGVAAIGLAWWRFARRRIPLGVLLLAPLHVLPALRAAAAALLRRRQEWNRTSRD